MSEFLTSLQGNMLLDGGQLKGSFFNRAVVLICQHNLEGAFGLVLNRKTENTIDEVLTAELPAALRVYPLFLGGPVQPGALSYLHSDAFMPEANVIENLSLGHSMESLIDLGESMSSSKQVRIFAGYAGWSPGQLEDEIKRKSWLIHPASIDLVFSAEPERLWQRILQKKGAAFRLLAEAPDDPSLN